MSEYVIMPSNDYQAACDAIRAINNKTDLIKSENMITEIEELIHKVGKIGFQEKSMVNDIYDWRSIVYADGKFVAISRSNTIAYSTNGLEWTEIELSFDRTYNWTSITYGNGTFVAVAWISNIAIYSTDGINWIETPIPFSMWNSVTYGNNKFIAIGDKYSGSANSYEFDGAYSEDGITWTGFNMPRQSDWKSITYGNNMFVAVAEKSKYAAYSTDGINWSQSTLPTSCYYEQVTYGNEKFIAIGFNENDYKTIIVYSNDGITWTQSPIILKDILWRSMTYGNKKFIAIGDYTRYINGISNTFSTIIYSNDGITWQRSKTELPKSWAIGFGDNKLIIISKESNIISYCDFNNIEIA